MQFYKYGHMVEQFMCEFLALLTINMLFHVEVMFNQLLNLLEKCCPPDDEHICSKHVETWNKLIIKNVVHKVGWY